MLLVSSAASCSAPAAGKLLGCGYIVNGTDTQRNSVVVDMVQPDATLSSCTVQITRIDAGGNGATVNAYAICRP